MRIKINLIIVIFFNLLCFIGISQVNTITQYENKKYSKLDVKLNGNVKYLREITENITNKNNEEIEYFFNKNNQPTKIVETSLGLDIKAREFRNKNTVFTFENGHLISELNKINKGLDGFTYEVNKAGNVTHEKFYVENRLVSEKIFEYNANNKLIKSTDYVYGYFRDFNGNTPENKNDYLSMVETFKYDKQNNRVEETMNNIKGDIFKKNLYKYDQNGNMIQEGWCKNYKGLSDKKKCNYQPSVGYEYNSKNELTKEYAIGNWSPHNTDTYYKYNDNGNKIEAKGFYITKKDTVLGYHYKYEYDDYGNKTKEKEIVGNYRSIGFEKYKTEKIEYDEFQNIILKEYITSDDKSIKVVQYEYSYDKNNNWIKRIKKQGRNRANLELKEIKKRTIKYYNQ